MAKKGPKQTPSRLRVIKGNPGNRPMNKQEPQMDGLPVCPDWLSDEGKRKWAELFEDLSAVGLLARVDGSALALACEHWSAAVEARKLFIKHGVLVEGRRGEPVKNPAAQLFKDNSEAYRKYISEFGLSPSSRAGLKVPEKESDNVSIRRFVGGPRGDE